MTEQELLRELSQAAARLVAYAAEVAALKVEATRLKAQAKAEWQYSEQLLAIANKQPHDYGLAVRMDEIMEAVKEVSVMVDEILAYIMRDSRMTEEDG